MGTSVTVDSDDLEALLLAAELGARVQVEVAACTGDAAFQRRRDTMRAAADRVRKQRADAVRPRDNPYEGRPPVGYELTLMREIAAEDDGVIRTSDIRKYETLRLKGLVVTGTGTYYITWGDKTKDTTADHMQYVRLTERGHKWLYPSADPRSLPA